MAAIEFVADKSTRARLPYGAHKIVAAKALEHGVLSRALPFLPVNSMSPPLSITEAEIDEATTRYAAALRAATPEIEAMR